MDKEATDNKISKINKEAIKLNHKALRLVLCGDKEGAIKLFQNTLKLDENFSDPYFHLGNIYIQSGNYKSSETMYKKAIGIDPNKSEYYYNLAIAQSNLEETNKAIKNYKKCLKLDPNNTKAIKFLGNCFKDIKNFKEAMQTYNDWINLEPENPEPVVCNSLIHVRNGRFDIGWKMYEAGLQNNIRELLNGFYEEKHQHWDGKTFEGTLLVYGEQGLGDQIFYGTLLPDLLKVQKNIYCKIDHRLHNLFKENFPSIKFFKQNEQIDKNSYEKYISIGSLSKFYRKHTNDYMNSEFKQYSFSQNFPEIYKRQIRKLPNLKIGLSWHTFAPKNSVKRSLSPSQVSRILSNNSNSFINLQYGEVSNSITEINQLSKNKLFTINNLDLTNDIDNVINVIKNCDLIITIDNTIAHLASSIGKNVWVLLPYSADARWMENIACSLTYQNTILIRQDQSCTWENVIKIIELALSKEKL